MKKIHAQTYTPFYDASEDRIRLCINYQDFLNRIDLMITRRFILDLIPNLEAFGEKYFNQTNTGTAEESKQKSETGKESQTDTADIVLYQNTQELLQKVDLHYIQEKNLIAIVFSSQEHVVEGIFEKETYNSFLTVLKNALPYVEWGIHFEF